MLGVLLVLGLQSWLGLHLPIWLLFQAWPIRNDVFVRSLLHYGFSFLPLLSYLLSFTIRHLPSSQAIGKPSTFNVRLDISGLGYTLQRENIYSKGQQDC